MIRILQHGCLPPCCQIWTDMFQQVREVDTDDTHTTTQTHTHTHICPWVQRCFSWRTNASHHTRRLSQAEKWKNVLLSGNEVNQTAVQNQQLSVQLETRGQKARIFLFNSQSSTVKSKLNNLLSFSVLQDISVFQPRSVGNWGWLTVNCHFKFRNLYVRGWQNNMQ